MKWITRERPKIDRIACPWLITRFIDKDPEFLFVPADQVQTQAATTGAIAYDVPGGKYTHVGDLCSFDAFVAAFGLASAPMERLAAIVRGADTARLDLAPQSAGLLALSLGLSHNFRDDHAMLRQGLILYDALYAWCTSCQGEPHQWQQPDANSIYGAWALAQ